jgi:Protein  of unknown function (DUF3018)
MANSTERSRKYREKMKAAGLKQVTIWVPDVDAPGFREQLARDIEMINSSEDEKRILQELSNSDWDRN